MQATPLLVRGSAGLKFCSGHEFDSSSLILLLRALRSKPRLSRRLWQIYRLTTTGSSLALRYVT
jgi:hypothetical protein